MAPKTDLLYCVNWFGIKIDLALLNRSNQILTYEDNCLMFKEFYTSTLPLTFDYINDPLLYQRIYIANMIISATGKLFFIFSFSVHFYMCNCYLFTYINVNAVFHSYICYNCYVIQRRWLHNLLSLVSDPCRFHEQIRLLYTGSLVFYAVFYR
jgi:hypothetical protein